ncbi:MAG: CBS domain-containing protein [Alphaproteobacteria bacterium]|nr:CBS domain-containing protein [Alphaproteobacteria bacterium]
MPCSDAMITEVVSARPDDTVADVLALFDKHGIRAVPVVDEKGYLVGVFNFVHLLTNILPVPVTLDNGLFRLRNMDISLDHISGTTPWVAKRLKIILPKKVEEVMIKNPRSVKPQTPLREGIRLMVKHGSPLPVVRDDSNFLVGIISSQTAVKALLAIEKDMEDGKEVNE